MDRRSVCRSRLLDSACLRGAPLAVLVLALFSSALVKLVTGYRAHYLLSEVGYYGVSFAEVVAAAMLFTRYRQLVAAGVVLLCAMMVVVVGWGRLDGACGCLGPYELSRSAHVSALCGIGATAALVGLLGDLRRAPRPA